MAESELNLALEWAAAEGWNPGLHDAECFYAADPEGFFLGEFAGGEPIGCVSAVAYDKHYGFLGFYIVKPQYRGRGFGLQLWDAAMHNPALHDLALELAHADLDKLLSSAGEKFPTGAMASFRFDGAWKALEPHGALLASFITPKSIAELP